MIAFRFPATLKLAVAALGFATLAPAQKLPTATAPGASITVGGTYSAFQVQYPQHVMGGAGIYADLNIRRSIGLEAEIHWLRRNEIDQSHQTTYLVGPRVELHRGRFSPFAKALVGDANFVFPDNSDAYYGNFLVICGGIGLDYQLTENLKLRAFDIEYQRWPQFNFGSGLQSDPIAPYGISAGLSYRVWHAGGWPHPRRHRR